MTIHKFAAMLHGREIGSEITRDEEKQAKELGYAVVFGASDDLFELRGAIDEEGGARDGTDVYIHDAGIAERPHCDCEYAKKWYEHQKKRTLHLEVIWCPNGGSGAAWGYKLHDNRDVATFDIMEDGELYCRGLVFSLAPNFHTVAPTTSPIIATIAAVLQKDYGLGQDSAPSIVLKVLELSAAHCAASPAGWSHDEHCPPEDLRGVCCEDCAACFEKAVEAIKRGQHD